MSKDRKKRFRGVAALFVSLSMILSSSPLQMFAADTITQGDWQITNTGSSGIAKLGDLGFTYYSPTTDLTYGASGGKDYVRSNNTNGSASNGIVVTKDKSYCDFKAPSDGTLTVYVGNASSKQGYVSKTDTNGTSTAVGQFVPGANGDYDNDEMTVTQGTTWATVNIETEKDNTYYFTLSGSKMFCYGAEFAPYTNLSGTINDSFGLNGYEIKLVNKETRKSINADVSGNTYSATVKPGEYSAALTGSNAINYAISSDTRLVSVESSETVEPKAQTHNFTIEESVSYKVSGTLSGIENVPSDMKLIFVPEDTASHENAEAEISGMSYSAQLVANENYTLKLEGAKDYELSEEVVVSNDNENAVTKDVSFKEVGRYDVTGGFIVLGDHRGEYKTAPVSPAAVKFTNVDDKYEYTGSISDGKYNVALRNGSYIASVTADGYSTSTHIVVDNNVLTRDILLKDTSKKEVSYTDTVYVGEDKEYKTIQAAVDAVAAMTGRDEKRVTIKIAPGTYREQVVVNTPNITLESESGNKNDTKITWYYGIGYKYYSCVDSLYDPYADYDKFEKGSAVKYWGSAVITQAKATGFRAKGITFENSFNKYMTDEEMEDGAEPDGLQAINVARKETTNVDNRASTERAAALVNYADKTEFSDCSFIGSQDTLYTCNVAYDAYYKNCYIEGQTDFIYGNGDVIFDGCEINFCGYDGSEAAGYLTANSCSQAYMATDGYIFRNCYISYNAQRDTTPGYFGRMWGDSAKVAFINTKLQQSDMIIADGWTAMSGNNPTSDKVTLVEYNTTYNGTKADTSKRVAGVKDTLDVSKYSVESVFIANGWTPAYYTPETDTKPEFKVDPAFTSNGDLNTPNPGETVTVGYELGQEWAANDASTIDWYAVNENFDNTSLETILKSATLLRSTSAVSTNKLQIPMECAGKFLMAVVTPMTLNGLSGDAKYIIDTEKTVSSNWSDPDNQGSIAPGSGINIYLAGDSTVKDYSAAGIYNGGKILSAGSWGEFLQAFFDEKYVTVNNYAQGGRSVRSFMNEGKLDTIIKNIKAGDYLLIQFGHNDCANGASYYQERFVPLYTKDAQPTSKSSGFPTIKPVESMKSETPSALVSQYGNTYYAWDCGATYKGFIQYYIDEALAKGAIPVVVSPVARLYYQDGKIKAHHDANMTDYAPTLDFLTENDAYVTACKEVYEENKEKGVLYIDAFNITKTMYEDAYTACGSDANGVAAMDLGDKTHSNKTGGVIQAGLIAKFIQDSDISLSPYVVQPTKVYGEETSGEYIFTIDKNGIFTAKDKNLKENSYWTKMGQNLFDSIGGKESVPAKEVSLNFATDDAFAMYETNAADTFTDGVLSGVYTNEKGVEFEASVYANSIQYYNSTAKYGTKINVGKPLFSFTAENAANYTVTTKAGTGSGTVALYSDAECKNEVASATVGENITYKKTSDTSQTLYFAAKEANNLYFAEATISYEIPKVLSLDFKDETVMKLYEDEATYTNGIFSGEYSNADGDTFSASIIQSGIQYYNHQAQYGTKATPKMPLFAITLTDKGMYTFDVSAGTGSGTVDLYKDADCTESVVSNSVPGSVIYKKKTEGSETLYFATSTANNLYVSEVKLTKSELNDETKIVFKGNIDGIENDDTNVELTLKGSTETVKISADDYTTKGTELIVGQTYEISAKGDKGVYTGTSIVTDESGKADLILSRIVFDFPFDFMDYYDDYKVYLDAMGYGNGDVTDAYSGITAHHAGIVQTDAYKQYGVKTNSNDIISFTSKENGTVKVSLDISVSSNDTLVLKVNGTQYGEAVSALQGEVVELVANVSKGDLVTVNTPTRSNLWFKSITATYEQSDISETSTESSTESATETSTEKSTETSTENTPSNEFAPMANLDADGNGIVFAAAIDSLNYKEVGFIFELDGKQVRRSTKTVYSTVEGSNYSASDMGGRYMYAFTIDDITESNFGAKIKVTPYAVTFGGKITLGQSREYSVDSLSQIIPMSIDDNGSNAVSSGVSVLETTAVSKDSGEPVDDAKSTDYTSGETIFASDETLSGSALVIEREVQK